MISFSEVGDGCGCGASSLEQSSACYEDDKRSSCGSERAMGEVRASVGLSDGLCWISSSSREIKVGLGLVPWKIYWVSAMS